MKNCLLCLATLLALSVGAADAQPLIYERGSAGSAPPGDGCEEGEVPDDGTVEAGYGWVELVTYAGFVERFDAAALSGGLERICICLLQGFSDPPDFDKEFQIVVYDDDGPSGSPGTLLASIPAIATTVPVFPPGAFYDYEVGGEVSSLPSEGNVFIGIEWQPHIEEALAVCIDEDTPPNGGYTMSTTVPQWMPIQEVSPFEDYGSMVIRAEGVSPPPTEIPTLGGIGLALLALLLVVASLRALIRRRT